MNLSLRVNTNVVYSRTITYFVFLSWFQTTKESFQCFQTSSIEILIIDLESAVWEQSRRMYTVPGRDTWENDIIVTIGKGRTLFKKYMTRNEAISRNFTILLNCTTILHNFATAKITELYSSHLASIDRVAAECSTIDETTEWYRLGFRHYG